MIIAGMVLAGVCTFLIRAFPYLALTKQEQLPKWLEVLTKTLPQAIMVLLVIYCLKDTQVGNTSSLFGTIVACLSVVVLHIWKRNTLISIVVPTILYMILT